MRRLPSLAVGPYRWQLPLTRQVSRSLPWCLLQRQETRRAGLLASLQQDVPLALWTLCRAFHRCGVELSDMEQLAAWLDEHAMDELRWEADEWGVNPPTEGQVESAESSPASHGVSRHEAADWQERLVRGVRVATAAAESARRESQEPEAGSRAYLAGLLYEADFWLESCRASICKEPSAEQGASTGSSRPASRACLPPRLARIVEQLGSAGQLEPPPAVEGLVRHVRRAIESSLSLRLTQGSIPSSAGQPALADDGGACPDMCGGSPPAFVDDLPALLERVARLTRIERDFDAELERQKLAAIKELAYGASHEINNPLANISTRAQTLLRDEADPERRRKLATINSQAFRAHEMISDLMLFAHPPEPVLETIELAEVARRVADEMREEADRQQTELIVQGSEIPVHVRADATLLAAAFQTLYRNALEALASGGRIDVRVGTGESPRRIPGAPWADQSGPLSGRERGACVEVRDNGPGLTEEVRRHAFEPYYSGREAGRGLGLGLSKCWRIATLHGGTVEVESEPGHGSSFRLWLPATTREPESGRQEEGSSVTDSPVSAADPPAPRSEEGRRG